MKIKQITTLFVVLICLLTSQYTTAQSFNGQPALSTQAAAERMAQLYLEEGSLSNVEELTDLEFWSILIQMDSIVEVVYKPSDMTTKIMDVTEPIDLKSSGFVQARNQVNNILAAASPNSGTTSLTGTSSSTNYDHLIIEEDDTDPYLLIKTGDPNIIAALRSDPNIDYVGFYSALDDEIVATNDGPIKPQTDKTAEPIDGSNRTEGGRTTEGKDGSTLDEGKTTTTDGLTVAGGAEGVTAGPIGGFLSILLELLSLVGVNGEHGCSGDREYPSNLPVAGEDYTIEQDGIGAYRPWHLDEIGVDIANEVTGGEGVKIAILDTGLSASQENLNDDFDNEYTPRYIAAKRTYRNDNHSTDDNCGHGTRMTATAAAPKIQGFVRGAAFRADVLNVKTNTDVMILKSSEFRGIKQALKKIRKDKPGYENVDIVSMSFGYLWPSWGIKRQLKKLKEKGVLLFAAAGTSDFEFAHNTSVYPARLDQTIGVTGVFENFENDPKKCTRCHQGEKVDFVVPLEKNDNAGNGDYQRLIPCLSLSGSAHVDNTGGSSAATATMAGVAALVKSEYPNASADQIITMLRNTATHGNNRHDDFGWGQVDVSQLIAPEPDPDPNFFALTLNGPQELIMDALNTFNVSVNGGSGNFSYNWYVQIPQAALISIDQNCVSGITTSTMDCPFTIQVDPNNDSNYADISVTVKDLDTNISKTESRRVYVSDIIF